MKKLYLVLFCVLLLPPRLFSQTLQPLGSGVELQGTVNAMEYDSVNNLIYVAGSFNAVNGVSANNIAVWDGTVWREVGGGVNGSLTAIKLINNNLYVGGTFQQAGGIAANNIAYWDGSQWHSMGIGLNPAGPDCIEPFNGKIYVSGANIYNSGATVLNGIGVWNGSEWNAIGKGAVNGTIFGMTIFHNELYLYGSFTQFDTSFAGGVIRYDGAIWSPLPETHSVVSITSFKDTLYIAANGGASSDSIFKFSNNHYEQFYTSLTEGIQEIFSFQNSLCAIMDSGYTIAKMNIVKFDSNGTYENLGYSNDNYYNRNFRMTLVIDSELYLFGSFTEINDKLNLTPALYQKGVWSNFASIRGSSFNDPFNYSIVNSLSYDSSSGNLIAGGNFYYAGDSLSPMVARWDGSVWHPMGLGLNGQVFRVLNFKNAIYACGIFTESGNDSLPGFAKWNGTKWVRIDTLNPTQVQDMVISDNKLYVVQQSTAPQNYLLAYDGVSWNVVSVDSIGLFSGASGFSLGTYQKKIVAANGAGIFITNSGDASVIYLDSTNHWRPMGTLFTFSFGLPKFINLNDTLFFCTNQIFKWNGSDWTEYLNDCYGNNCNQGISVFILQNHFAYSFNNDGLYVKYADTTKYVEGLDVEDAAVINAGSLYVGGFFPYLFLDGVNPTYFNSIGKITQSAPTATIKISDDSLCDHGYVTFTAGSADIFNSYQWICNGATPSPLYTPIAITQYKEPGSFTVKLVVSNLNGVDTLSVNRPVTVYNCTTGVQNLSADNNSFVYPNPASAYLHLSFANNEYVSDIRVINLLGVELMDIKVNNSVSPTIDISNLEPGSYILSAVTKTGCFYNRFIKF